MAFSDRARIGIGHGANPGTDRDDRILGLARVRATTATTACPASALHCERILRRGLDALEMGEHADLASHHLASSEPVMIATMPGAFFASVEVIDLCVSMRRTHEGDMCHARQCHVADVLRAALSEACEIGRGTERPI